MLSRLFLSLGFTAIASAALADTPIKRLTLRQDSLGWEAVGRLDIGGDGFCSGTLIAPDLVLTAAHCLIDQYSGERVAPDSITFRAALTDGVTIAERRGLQAVIHPAYHPFDRDGLRQLTSDVALLKLESAIPAGTAAPFVTSSRAGQGSDVSVVSYAKGREAALSWQKRCEVTAKGQGALMFNCDVWFGSSGAPVFETSGGRGRIVSIISRGQRDGNHVVVFGPQIERPLAEVKRALREGRGVWPELSVQAKRIQPGGAAGAGPRSTGARFLKP